MKLINLFVLKFDKKKKIDCERDWLRRSHFFIFVFISFTNKFIISQSTISPSTISQSIISFDLKIAIFEIWSTLQSRWSFYFVLREIVDYIFNHLTIYHFILSVSQSVSQSTISSHNLIFSNKINRMMRFYLFLEPIVHVRRWEMRW